MWGFWVRWIGGGEGGGPICLKMEEGHFALDEEGVSFLPPLASSLRVALENARLLAETRRLLDETQQRNAELAVINSVQQGLAAQLDFQGVIDLVGDKLREVLHTGDLGIRLYDRDTGLLDFVYNFEHGLRLSI